MRRAPVHVLFGILLLAVACGHEFEPPDQAARRAQALERYSPSIFDTIAWVNDSVRAAEGNEVYAVKCARCHGPLGRGGTPYARERGFEVASLVEPNFPLAEELDSVRKLVFTGHGGGMPIFGIAGISPREIDGSSYYILEVLRPDVLEGADGAR